MGAVLKQAWWVAVYGRDGIGSRRGDGDSSTRTWNKHALHPESVFLLLLGFSDLFVKKKIRKHFFNFFKN
jgi:hypothetical protein